MVDIGKSSPFMTEQFRLVKYYRGLNRKQYVLCLNIGTEMRIYVLSNIATSNIFYGISSRYVWGFPPKTWLSPGHGFPDDGRHTKLVASLDQPSLHWESAESAGCEPGPLDFLRFSSRDSFRVSVVGFGLFAFKSNRDQLIFFGCGIEPSQHHQQVQLGSNAPTR